MPEKILHESQASPEPQEIDLPGVRRLLVNQIELNLALRERMMPVERDLVDMHGEIVRLKGRIATRELLLYATTVMAVVGAALGMAAIRLHL